MKSPGGGVLRQRGGSMVSPSTYNEIQKQRGFKGSPGNAGVMDSQPSFTGSLSRAAAAAFHTLTRCCADIRAGRAF